jgi:Zn finger protein HypA/HybF involved in hydrogenase expression
MMADVQAYCVKCRKKSAMKDAKEVVLKNGRAAMKGKCPKCGTGMFRIGGMAAGKKSSSASKSVAKKR